MLTKFTCTSKIHSNQSINGREKVGIKKLKNPDAFIDYSQSARHYFIIKIPNKRELQQIASNLFDTEFEDFMKPYMDCRKSHIS